jgi:thiamine-phosphate pyrophosphorylase
VRLHALVDGVTGAGRAAEGGATVVQLRLKGADYEHALEVAHRVRELCLTHGVLFAVNDDARLALEAGADYVHLGQDDLRPDDGPPALPFGISVASGPEAARAERRGAAYLGAGPVWATPSKPDAGPPIGLDGLRAIADSVSIPVVAIGGIDSTSAAACIQAGAAGVAVIRAVAEIEALRAAVDAAL